MAIEPTQDPGVSTETPSDGPLSSIVTEHPTQIAAYRIVREIGAGGMGIVYEAIEDRLERRVALKVIRPGFMTPDMLRRFEYEATLLARLEHPGIARIYRADLWNSGTGQQPYFAMEYVEGEKLDEFVKRSHPRLKQRQLIELFQEICQAVQAAHGKGIVHRDLKPDNILITTEGKPKILDFGIARAIDAAAHAGSLHTESGALVGTVPYMAPEQIRGQVDELDHATDVYALGVIGYELLSGRMPYPVKGCQLPEAARIICENEPTQLSSIDSSLRGDIETIVGKALEKQKAERYHTAGELAADLKRHLDYQPITARPPGAWYNLKKFTKRNRVVVTATFVLFIVLLAGIAASVTFALRESRQRNLAQKRADDLKAVTEFQESMLSDIDPRVMGEGIFADIRQRLGQSLQADGKTEQQIKPQLAAFDTIRAQINPTDVARQLLDQNILSKAVAAIDRQFANQPEINATLRERVALVYRVLGMYEPALAQEEKALEMRRRVLGDSHPNTLDSVTNVGAMLRLLGKHVEAEQKLRDAVESSGKTLGGDHSSTLSAMNSLAVLLSAQGRHAEAEALHREILERHRRIRGGEDQHTLISMMNLGAVLISQAKLAEAEPLLRETIEGLRRVKGNDNPYTLAALNHLGELLIRLRRFNDAEPLLQETLQQRRRALGEDHPETIISTGNLGNLFFEQGKYPEAERLLTEALTKSGSARGSDHPTTIGWAHTLGILARKQGKLAEAESILRGVLQERRRLLGEDHEDTLSSLNSLAVVLQTQRKLAEAELLLRQAMEARRRVSGEEHPETVITIYNVGFVLQHQGKLAQAELLYREALEKRRRVSGNEAPETLTVLNALGEVLRFRGKLDDSEALLREAVEGRRRVLGEDHPETLTSVSNLGFVLHARKKFADAESYLRDAAARSRQVLGEDDPNTLTVITSLGAVLEILDQRSEAEMLLREALVKRRRVLGEDHVETLRSLHNMGYVLRAQGKLAGAEPFWREAVEKRRGVLGRDHPDTVASMLNLGALLVANGKLDEAEPLLSELNGLRGASQLTAQQATVVSASYGLLLAKRGRYREAEEPLREAHRRLRESNQQRTKTMRNVVAALAQVCDKTNRPDESADWRAELETLEPATRPADAPATRSQDG